MVYRALEAPSVQIQVQEGIGLISVWGAVEINLAQTVADLGNQKWWPDQLLKELLYIWFLKKTDAVSSDLE